MKNDRFNRFVDGALGIVGEAWDGARANFINDIRSEERDISLSRAALAMLDGGLSEEKVIAQLQKYWDLRRSEAVLYITWAQQELGIAS